MQGGKNLEISSLQPGNHAIRKWIVKNDRNVNISGAGFALEAGLPLISGFLI